jgi:hypothetical protein
MSGHFASQDVEGVVEEVVAAGLTGFLAKKISLGGILSVLTASLGD